MRTGGSDSNSDGDWIHTPAQAGQNRSFKGHRFKIGGANGNFLFWVCTFLSVSTAKFVSYLWSPGLSQKDLDEESVFSVR